MSELKKLVASRGQMKAKLSRFETFVNSLTESIDFIELKSRMENISPLIDQFNDVQLQITIISDSEGSEVTEIVDEFDVFEKRFFKIISKAKGLMSDINHSTQNISGSSQGHNESLNNVKLPTLDLPRFSGCYDEWLSFHDTFHSLIHSNTTLSDIQKFHYLSACLKGDAATVIQSLEISNANYQIAWQLLKERFDNKRIIIRSHVKSIFDLDSLSKGTDHALRNLIDNFKKHVRALENLKEPTDHWDTLLVYIILNKLDSITRQEWERTNATKQTDSVDELINFLNQKCVLIETMKAGINHNSKFKEIKPQGKVSTHLVSNCECFLCKQNHMIYNCAEFLKLSVKDRIKEVKRLNLCLNCLRKGHSQSNCISSKCRQCNNAHNTLLHLPVVNNSLRQGVVPGNSNSTGSTTLANHSSSHTQVLLSTAEVQVIDKTGEPITCRVLLDNGSQSNFITKQFCNKLGLNTKQTHVTVTGIGQTCSVINESINIKFRARHSAFQGTASCLVSPKITEQHPQISFDPSNLNIPINLVLADPNFSKSGNIDMLLGASIFWQLLCIGQISLGKNNPTMQRTKLGWIVSGDLNYSKVNCMYLSQTQCNLNQLAKNIDDNIVKFWEIEEVQVNEQIKPDSSNFCEEHFANNTLRTDSGRFVVKLPFKDTINRLGDSKQMALKRFYSTERKLSKNNELSQQYHSFMREYIELGHMSETNQIYDQSYFLPHHSVVKQSSLTTKLRVVFDGSAKTDSGYSLNDCLTVGPILQDDLFSIIIRFREYPIVLTADVAKMYRQVLIHPNDRQFQQILWRFCPNEPVKAYTLNTVTYGTASASFLAIRCLQQAAKDHEQQCPKAAQIICRDFYVDDLITGVSSVDEAINIQKTITNILDTGGFKLRKWTSNCPEVINQLSNSNADVLSFSEHENCSTLGLQWNSQIDSLQYQITQNCTNNNVTKRSILSSISQIFDPLGLLAPTVIIAKLIIQKLWQEHMDWDESVSQCLYNTWIRFYNSLQSLNSLQIPRFVLQHDANNIELHGFCDASENAYGAAIYIRTQTVEGLTITKLFCAKSRVAPLKAVTLARLELCGALLLARLAERVRNVSNINFCTESYYTDSTIVLSWLQANSTQWKTFVANRTSEIQSLTNVSNWKHVKSSDNPADLISRGLNANCLVDSDMWWHGPFWFQNYEPNPSEVVFLNIENLPEVKKQKVLAFSASVNNTDDVFEKYSSFSKLQRTYAYVYRFVDNCRDKENRNHGPLSLNEINSATTKLIQIAQRDSFLREISALEANKPISSRSALMALNPFLDSNNVLRVGGRLAKSNYNFNKRHPIILPEKHVLTNLIFRHYHVLLLHASSQLLLASVREVYWPIRGKNLSKKTCRRCVTCFKTQPSTIVPQMAELPAARLLPSRPFSTTGIDYAGPFLIRDRNTRGFKLIKSFVCIFVCFVTKAIHIELVSDLSSETFIAALRRFISRRGFCSDIYSDNATNFVGANSEIAQMTKLINQNFDEINNYLLQRNIKWHFIPPRSPHFGGLWEAGVKSIKTHLKRTIGNAHLNYEQLYTILTQVEACLNSRPLNPLSDDPNDLNPLTPAHFLIGDSLTSLPDPDLSEIKETRLSRFQRCQQLLQHFWKRWHKEYISTLQTRSKWKSSNQLDHIKIGNMVLLREENLPPLKWKLGRIVDIHPGTDNIVRVASVKTVNGVVKRAITKLAVLPVET